MKIKMDIYLRVLLILSGSLSIIIWTHGDSNSPLEKSLLSLAFYVSLLLWTSPATHVLNVFKTEPSVPDFSCLSWPLAHLLSSSCSRQILGIILDFFFLLSHYIQLDVLSLHPMHKLTLHQLHCCHPVPASICPCWNCISSFLNGLTASAFMSLQTSLHSAARVNFNCIYFY